MSTIKVDTYLTRGGASEIAIDKLKGASSASSISIVGEGGSTTTNLQQGLAKGWMNLTGTGTIAAKDSFNMSATTDHGTGAYTVSLGNDMNNNDWVVSGYAGVEGVTNGMIQLASTTGKTTALIRFNVWSGSEVQDSGEINIACHGDLA
tara:strand:+ start:81 stop:527 length:447 start_codon:yes stop_codon:yes gene_type:complete